MKRTRSNGPVPLLCIIMHGTGMFERACIRLVTGMYRPVNFYLCRVSGNRLFCFVYPPTIVGGNRLFSFIYPPQQTVLKIKFFVLCSLLHTWFIIWARVLHTFWFCILEAAVSNNRIDNFVAPLFMLISVSDSLSLINVHNCNI